MAEEYRFIPVVDIDNQKIWINVDKIVSFHQIERKTNPPEVMATRIILDADSLDVKDSCEDIMDAIAGWTKI